MQIKNSINIEIWDKFVGEQKQSRFTQSWAWGSLAESEGKKIFRLGVEENGKLVAVVLMIKNELFGGLSYFYSPRGPIISSKVESDKVIKLLFEEIESIAKSEHVIFLRFEPLSVIRNTRHIIKKTIDIQPAKTSMIYLREDDKELLDAMHPKTRYNIKLAQKKGVIVRRGNEKDFENFWSIFQETIKRDGFRLHSKEHYLKLIKEDWINLYLAEYQGQILAGSIICFFGDTATYMHGASSNEHRSVMAPYTLQWHCVKEAREKNCHFYDFYGIDEKKWPGVTRFKLGFGGRIAECPGTYDVVFNPMWYNVYKIFRFVRRKV